jgi:hypothetical protein
VPSQAAVAIIQPQQQQQQQQQQQEQSYQESPQVSTPSPTSTTPMQQRQPQQMNGFTLPVPVPPTVAPSGVTSDLTGHTDLTQSPSFSLISSWISSFLDSTLLNLPRFPAPALAQLLLDVTNAGGQPGAQWLLAYSQALESRLEFLSTGDLVSVVLGLETLLVPHKKAKLVLPIGRGQLGDSSSTSAAAATSKGSRTSNSRTASNGSNSLQQLGDTTGSPTNRTAANRKARSGHAAQQQQQQQGRKEDDGHHTSRISEEEVMDRLLRKVVRASEGRLQSFSIDQIARLMISLANVQYMPPPSWARSAAVTLCSCQAALPELSAVELAQLSASVIRLRITPGQAWWAALTEAIRPHFSVNLSSGSHTSSITSSTSSQKVLPPLVLADLMWAVTLSKYRPDRAWWSAVMAAVEAHLGRKPGWKPSQAVAKQAAVPHK